MSTEDKDDRDALGGAPSTPSPAEEGAEDLRDRCRGDRNEMSPRETSDCAGQDLVDEYENEEDGGS